MADQAYRYGLLYMHSSARAQPSQNVQHAAQSTTPSGNSYYDTAHATATTSTSAPATRYPEREYGYTQAYRDQGTSGAYEWSSQHATFRTGATSTASGTMSNARSTTDSVYGTSERLGGLAYAFTMDYTPSRSCPETTQGFGQGQNSRNDSGQYNSSYTSATIGGERTACVVGATAYRPQNSGYATVATSYAATPEANESAIQSRNVLNLPVPSPSYPQGLVGYPSSAVVVEGNHTASTYAADSHTTTCGTRSLTTTAKHAAPMPYSSTSTSAPNTQAHFKGDYRRTEQKGRASPLNPSFLSSQPPTSVPQLDNDTSQSSVQPQAQQASQQTMMSQVQASTYMPRPSFSASVRHALPQRRTSPSPPRPTTVAPKQIYNNDHEMQRQIAAANAEHARLLARKEAEEAAAVLAAGSVAAKEIARSGRRPQSNPARASSSGVTHARTTTQAPGAASIVASTAANVGTNHVEDPIATAFTTNVPVSTNNDEDPQHAQMEAEMRAMVEKMREYQSKDPKLFGKVWESVKKTQTLKPGQSPMLATSHTAPPAPAISRALVPPERMTVDAHQEDPDDRLITEDSIMEDSVMIASSTIDNDTAVPAMDDTGVMPATRTSAPVKKARAKLSRKKEDVAERARIKEEKRAAKLKSTAAAKAQKVAMKLSLPNNLLATSAAPGAQNYRQSEHTSQNPPQQAPVCSRVQVPILPPAKTPITLQPAPNDMLATNTVYHTTPVAANTSAQRVKLNLQQQQGQPPYVSPQQGLTNAPSQVSTNEQSQASMDVTPPIWEKKYRAEMSMVAVNILNTLKENEGKTISAEVIEGFFDLNLSYDEVCTSIERCGFKMDRARMAQKLLAAMKRLDAADRAAGSAQAKGYQDKDQEIISRPTHGKGSRAPRGPYAKTRNKEQDSSDASKHMGTPRKRKRACQAGALFPDNNSMNSLAAASGSDAQKYHDGASQAYPTSEQPSNPSAGGYSNPYLSAPVYPIVPGGGETGIRHPYTSITSVKEPVPRSQPRPRVARPAPAPPPPPPTKAMMARKRTFADVLGAASNNIEISDDESDDNDDVVVVGENRARPVVDNEELSKLQHEGGGVDLSEADAETAALICALAPESTRSTHEHANLQYSSPNDINIVTTTHNPLRDFESIVDPVVRTSAVRRIYFSSATIVQDVLIACSLHPDARGLNAHFEPLVSQFSSVDTNSDLSTFRWDIVDPGGPALAWKNRTMSGSVRGHNKMRLPSTLRSQVDLDAEMSDGEEMVYDRSDDERPDEVVEQAGRTSMSTSVSEVDGRRDTGRPKRTAAAVDYTVPGLRIRAVEASPKSRPRFNKQIASKPTASQSTSRSTQQARPTEPTDLTGDDAEQGDDVTHKPYRTVMASHPEVSRIRQKMVVKFPEFKCQWHNCPAQLHNLETLRLHLERVHVTPDWRRPKPATHAAKLVKCLWKNCEDRGPHVCPEPLQRHLEEHIAVVKSKSGDGPPASLLTPYVPDLSYLFDVNGRQVTPSIEGQLIIPDGRLPNTGTPAQHEAAVKEQARIHNAKFAPGPSGQANDADAYFDTIRQLEKNTDLRFHTPIDRRWVNDLDDNGKEWIQNLRFETGRDLEVHKVDKNSALMAHIERRREARESLSKDDTWHPQGRKCDLGEIKEGMNAAIARNPALRRKYNLSEAGYKTDSEAVADKYSRITPEVIATWPEDALFKQDGSWLK